MTVDLTNCDREPIHEIGHVQPHGALLVVDAEGRVTHASANTGPLLGRPIEQVLGAPLAALLGEAAAGALRGALGTTPDSRDADDAGERAVYDDEPRRVVVDGAPAAFDAFVHAARGAHAGSTLIEIETLGDGAAGDAPPSVAAVVRRTMARIAAGRSVTEVAGAVADEVRRLTGFDRVWVYRFHEDWHGEVIAESARDGLESWLGLHYPASDIPAQARALFARHWIRVIPDVEYDPAELLTSPAPQGPAGSVPPHRSRGNGPAVDLSDCTLRGVSPIHVQYLRNMGVRGSMSVSLVRGDRLWGLVSCHHYDGPRRASPAVRSVCEVLGQAFSTQLGMVEEVEDRDRALQLAAVERRLLDAMAAAPDPLRALTASDSALPALAGATGAAVCTSGGECLTAGRTPTAEQIVALIGWLAAEAAGNAAANDTAGDAAGSHPLGANRAIDRAIDAPDDGVVVTATLSTRYPPAAAYADVASGLLALPLGVARAGRPAERPAYVLWFRPEQRQTVAWGGDPRKPAEVAADDSARLTPRGSFARWEEDVRGTSLPWQRAEVRAAQGLRGTLADALLRHAEALAALNRDLSRSNQELDDFTYVASHDLKEPLRGIHNYAAIVKADYAGAPLGDDGAAMLDTMMRLTTRLDGLIESLLQHARVSRLELEPRVVSAHDALSDALERVDLLRAERGTEIRVPRPLPNVWADPDRLTEVFFNLVANAIKYGADTAPWVEIGYLDSEAAGGPVTFYVRDNGIGIEPRYQETIFRLFKRLHPRAAYGGGSGAGLTIVRKIVERHGGRVWVESAAGRGATFYFVLDAATADIMQKSV